MLVPRSRFIIPLLSCIVADDKRMLGEILEETFRRRSVDEEVQSLGGRGQRQERQGELHLGQEVQSGAQPGSSTRQIKGLITSCRDQLRQKAGRELLNGCRVASYSINNIYLVGLTIKVQQSKVPGLVLLEYHLAKVPR